MAQGLEGVGKEPPRTPQPRHSPQPSSAATRSPRPPNQPRV